MARGSWIRTSDSYDLDLFGLAIGLHCGFAFRQLVHGGLPCTALPHRFNEVVAGRGDGAGVGYKCPEIHESGQV